MARDCCQKCDGLSQKLDKALKDMEELKHMISSQKLDVVLKDMEELKHMISQVITAQGVDTSLREEHNGYQGQEYASPKKRNYPSPSYSCESGYPLYYPDPALLNLEPSPELRPRLRESEMLDATIVRPFFGMSVVDVDHVPYEIWKRFKISPEQSYVAVKEVYKGSLADINDVRSGDLVVTCNGIPIKSAKQYYQLMSETLTTCGDSGQRSFTVVINPFDGRSDSISIEADSVSVDDTRSQVETKKAEADE